MSNNLLTHNMATIKAEFTTRYESVASPEEALVLFAEAEGIFRDANEIRQMGFDLAARFGATWSRAQVKEAFPGLGEASIDIYHHLVVLLSQARLTADAENATPEEVLKALWAVHNQKGASTTTLKKAVKALSSSKAGFSLARVVRASNDIVSEAKRAAKPAKAEKTASEEYDALLDKLAKVMTDLKALVTNGYEPTTDQSGRFSELTA